MKCFYHNDADGRCAAAIVNQVYKSRGGYQSFVEMDYKDDVDISQIVKNEEIIIVDFSFKPIVMNEILQKTTRIIWIDHHETAFEYEEQYGRQLAGSRQNKYSGCELTWKYYYPRQNMPSCVELIGDRDKWSWKLENTAAFNQGLKFL